MASTSFAPELNFAAKKPTFNADPATLFEDGNVPADWKTCEAGDAVAPGASTGAVKSVVITDPQGGFSDGADTGVATTALTGGGTGLKVDVVVSGGQLSSASVSAGGTGYKTNDTVTVTGYTDTVLTVSLA